MLWEGNHSTGLYKMVVERTAQVETPWLFTRLQCPVRQGAVKVGVENADDGILQRSMQSLETRSLDFLREV
jgi:hypothetical protein